MRAASALAPLLLASILLALAPAPAGAQPRTEPGVFGEVIDVRVINLEIVVTDQQGNRVPGLGPQDFELTVDGKPVTIEFFTEIVSGTAVERPAAEAGGAKSVPQLVPGEPVPRHFLVFVDESFSRQDERDRVVESLFEQLSYLRPEDRMAVVAFDGERLEMLSTWRPRGAELERALRRAQTRPTHGLSWEAELRGYDSRLKNLEDETFASGDLTSDMDLTQTQEQAVMRISDRIERVVLAASSTLRSFAGPPGRKVMLLVSGGWPYDPVRWVVVDSSRATLQATMATGEELYAPLIQTANRLGYTLYPIDTPGIREDGTLSEIGTLDRPFLSNDVGSSVSRSFSSPGARPDAVTAGSASFGREVELDNALATIARETGGEAFIDSRNIGALEGAADDTLSYYWLGFTPDFKGSDRAHKVRIESKRPGLEVRSRRSYTDLSRQTEVTMMTESALLFGNPPSGEPLLVKLGQPTQLRAKSATLPVTVMIPVHLLTFLPHEKGFVAATELRVAVLDEAGKTAEIPVIDLPIVLDQMPSEGQVQRYETSLKVRRQKHDIVVSLYDVASGRILSTRVEADPG